MYHKEKPKLFSDEEYELVIDKTFENKYETINIKSTAGNIYVKEKGEKKNNHTKKNKNKNKNKM